MKNTYFMLKRSGLPRAKNTWFPSLLSLSKKRHLRTFHVCVIALLLLGIQANAQFSSVPATGYNADVVADGSGLPSTSTTNDVDGAAWVFVSSTFNPAGTVCVTGSSAMPVTNQVASLTTSGLTYDLQPYTANNSLRIPGGTSGTLTLTTPVSASNIYLLALGGSGACTISATITFTDLTTQTASGTAADWCSGTSAATTIFYRIQRTATSCSGGTCQYMYDVNLAINPANYGKSIASIQLANTGGVLNVMGVGMKAPCSVPAAQPSAIVSSSSTIGSISGSFTAASTVPTHYLVVRYPAGTATITAPVNGTTYTTGNLLGAGTVVSAAASATTTFTASGLNGATSYDFYAYSYNSATNCGGPIYLTTSPPMATLATTLCGTSFSGTIPIGPGLPNTPAGGYTSITDALNAIATNGLDANTVLELQSGYSSATAVGETFPLTLPFNGCINSGRTLTIRPAASVSSPLVITSSNATATFDLTGSQYLIVDGRPGGTGTSSMLQIINTSASGVAIKFSNDAQNNTFTYCDIQGQNTVASASATASGVIYFGAANTNLLGGNDNNVISYCSIHGTSGGNPALGICSFGTATSTSSPNSSNVITNCNIYDYLNLTGIDVGILLSTGSTDWTIVGNSIYQTATRTQTTAATDIGISIANTSGNNFIIAGNYIGGSAANAASTAWTIAGSIANRFRGISISAGTTTASTISGNTIANFAHTSNSSATAAGGAWTGIYLAAGAANITGNTIGSGTGNGSITVNMVTNSGGRSSGIYSDATSGISTISGNTIGSVTISGAVAAGFSGIVNTGAATFTINGNTIGSTSTVNSINANTTYTGTTSQIMYGIHNTGASTIAITNNTIANLNNAYLPASANTANLMTGILSTAGQDSIVGNTIYNFTIGANNTGTGTASSIIGIALTSTSTTSAHTVSQNTIYSLSNTNASAATYVQGIYISGATSGNNIVARNLIYNLAVSSTATGANVIGITANAGLFSYQNNMIRLGLTADGSASITNPISIIGFNEVGGTAGSAYYFNSIYVGGTNVTTGATATYAFKSATTNTRTIQNNIFVNDRSNNTGSGKHYAITVAGTTVNPTGLTCDYNIMFTSGTGGVLGLFNSADVTTLSNWQTATGLGYSSLSLAPGFVGATAATADLHITGSTPVESSGLPVAAVITDFDGGSRASLTPTDIGADAGNFTANDVSAPVISNTTVVASTCLLTNQVVTATITDASGVPAALSGTEPRIYYKRVSPNASSYFSAAGTLTSGSTANGVWSFTIDHSVLPGGIATGDSINYYITAQDIVSNIGANPAAGFAATNVNTVTTPPTTQYAYNINYTLGGNYNVGSTGTFPTLTAAIKAYNNACLTGPVKFLLTDNNYSTSETFPIIIAKNSNGSATNTLTIQPTQTSTVINSTAGSNTFLFNGGKYVTFDGRIGGIGSTPNLTIQNGLSTGIAINFINDAQYDTINYCTVLATNGSASSGMIVFGTTTFTTTSSGNSFNVISNCTIDGGAGSTASPTVSSSANAIYSAGTATYTNKYNIIDNNNILDYFQASVASNGILLSTNTSDWTISSNKFYQTNPRTQVTTAAAHMAINIASSGNAFQIRNNVIGYSTNSALGTYTINSAIATTFRGMSLTLGTTTASTIQGNTIDGISLTTTASGTTTSSPWMAMYISTGIVNMGDTTANTIGSQSATGTLQYSTNAAAASDVYGIYYNGSSAVNISNNTFGGITAANTNGTQNAANIYVVRTSTSTAALTFSNNTIGGTVANSIQSTSANTGTIVAGILNTAMAATMNGNTIRNLSSVDGTGTGISSAVSGISSSSSAASTISNNVINNLSSSGTAANVAGITITAGSTVTVSGNTINTLSGSGITLPVVRGIIVSGGTTVNVLKNKIYDLSQSGAATTSPSVNGMTFSGGTTINAYNNLIGDLRAPAANSTEAIRGIAVTSTTTTTTYRVYYNSVYLSASSSGTDFGTTGIYHTNNATSTTAALDLRNNIFVDLSTPSGAGIIASFRRSGTALNNYATTSNRNQFYAGTPGTANLIMYDGTNSYQTIATFQAAVTSRDLNSFTGESGFVYSTAGSFFQSVTGSSAQFLSPVAGITTQCEGGAATITTPAITDDYAGNLRSATTPDVGAWEFAGITPTPALTLNSVTPPATAQCTATDRTISVDVTTPVGSITSVTLNYTFNNVAQTPVTMTNTIGNTWTGVIVAPTSPTNATVAWSATALNSIGVSGTLTGPATYADVPLSGVVATGAATFTTICAGTSTDLSVSMSSTTPTAYSWSDGSTVVGTTNPLTVSPTVNTTYTCTVTALGCTVASSSVAITANPLPSAPTATGSIQCGFAIPSASVTSTSGASGPAFNWYSAATGGTLLQSNPYTGLMPFYSNDFSSSTLTNASLAGVASIGSGILTLQTNAVSLTGGYTINSSGYNSDQYQIDFDMTTVGPTTMADGFSYNFGDDVSASAVVPSAEKGTGSKLKIGFFTYNAINTNNGRGIYLMYNLGDGTYTAATPGVLAYSTNTSFINATQHITITINTLGQVSLTVGGTAIFTNVQLPASFLTADKSTWSHVIKSRSGGVAGGFSLDNIAIQASQPAPGSTTYLSPINATTTFYVSEFSGGCPSTRTPVTVTVTTPDTLNASASATANVCANTPISLSVSQIGSVNTYALNWSATPATGSGIATTVSGSLGTPTPVTPTTAGTYGYVVTGFESASGCTTTDTVTVVVIDPFAGVVITSDATPNPLCVGSNASVSVNFGNSLTPPTYTTPPAVTYPTTDEDIGNITITRTATSTVVLNNTSAANTLVGTIGTATGTAGSFANYTAFGPYTLIPGQAYGLSLTSLQPGNPYNNAFGVWIDYNHNGSFSDAGEAVYISGALTSGGHTETGSFTVPLSAVTGNTRMRVLNIEASIPSSPTVTANYGEYEEYMVNIIPNVSAYSWSDGSTVVGTTNPITVSPATSTTYTPTITVSGCVTTGAPVTLNVNPLPSAPTAVSSAHCGLQVPSATVTSTTGAATPVFNWYAASTGGTPVQSGNSNTYTSIVSTTTTFYVSETYNSCESARTPVTITVTVPNAVNASTTPAANACANAPLSLSVSQTGSTNIYSFVWTASGTGNGITGSTSGSLGSPTIVTPTAAGTYTYTVTATESGTGCITNDTTIITVIDPFNGVTVTANASISPVCSGTPTSLSVSLTGGNPTLTAFSWTDGSTVVGTTNPLSVSPTTPTTYTCTVTSSGCTAVSSSTSVGITALPSAPTATGSIQCGLAVPLAVVTSTSGAATPSFNWYSAATGGTLLQGAPFSALMPYYSNDFSSATLTNSSLAGAAAIGSGVLTLQTYITSSAGGFTVNASGYNSDKYKVEFDMTTGTTASIADGMSYNFGDDVSATTATPSAEHGTGSRLRIGFFTYNAASGSDGKGIYLMYNVPAATTTGYTAATTGVLAYSTNISFINTTSHVIIDINAAGQLTLTVGGTVIFNQVQLPSDFTSSDKSTWAHVIKSRSGGVAGTFGIDNIDIQASQQAAGSTTYLTPISATTTFYVSELSGGCLSTRTPVTVTVTTPDPLTASSSATSNVCANTPISLSVSQTGTTNTYSFTWTASPATGSGIPTSVAGALGTPTSVTPTAAGTYTYTITGTESGTACTTTATKVVTVIDPFNGVTVTAGASANPVCSGSPTSLSVSLSGGSPTISAYSWSDGSTTVGTTNPLTVSPTTNTTYSCTVTSSGCVATSSSTTVTVNPLPTAPTTTNSTQCATGVPTASATSTTGAGSPVFNWYVAPVGGSLLQSSTSTTYTSSISTTTTFYVSELGGGCLSPRTAVTATVAPSIGGSVTGAASVCTGNTSGLLTLSGYSGSITGWESSVSPFTSWTPIANTLATYTSGTLTQETHFRAVVVNGSCPSANSSSANVLVNNTNNWSGTTSTDWGTTSNWGCGRVPLITDDVVIVSGGNQPVIIDAGRNANNLSIGSGATLTLNNTASHLTIGGSFTNSGTVSHTAGEIELAGSSAQIIPAGTYNRINVNNATGVSLGGNVSINESVVLNSGNVTLGSNNLTLAGSTSTITNASASRFIITNGTGSLHIQNIGTSGRTGAVSFPVGSGAAAYTPVTIDNTTGTGDEFGARVYNNVFNTYTGSTGSGAAVTTGAVDRTWIVNEGTAGGSAATVTMQWNGADELSGFTRASSYAANYLGGASGWAHLVASAAAGTDPYTQAYTGLTNVSGPFSVGSGSTLPVKLLTFAGTPDRGNVNLTWSTATEINNKGFDIERSADGKTFTKVDFVRGAGNTATLRSYSLVDAEAFSKAHADVLYYRLKQLDFDGKYTYSNTISVSNTDGDKGKVAASPNPFVNDLGVSLTASNNGTALMIITDVQGREIATRNLTFDKGTNSYTVTELNNAYNGIYFVKVIMNGETSVIKVTKVD